LGHDADLDALPSPIGVTPAGGVPPDERYSLTIAGDHIVVRSVEAIGAARGLTTLLQLLATASPDAKGAVSLPAVHILDAPRFVWHGFTFDVARTYFTPQQIKRVIDLLALYKFNVLHLHLTDDQAWRIEAGRSADQRKPDGTFYTNAELRDIVH
jgi:hexosaminidase